MPYDIPYPSSTHAGAKHVRRKPGRRKPIGSLDFTTGVMKWFVGYCHDCDGKVLVDRADIDKLRIEVAKTKRSLAYRLFLRIVRHMDEHGLK